MRKGLLGILILLTGLSWQALAGSSDEETTADALAFFLDSGVATADSHTDHMVSNVNNCPEGFDVQTGECVPLADEDASLAAEGEASYASSEGLRLDVNLGASNIIIIGPPTFYQCACASEDNDSDGISEDFHCHTVVGAAPNSTVSFHTSGFPAYCPPATIPHEFLIEDGCVINDAGCSFTAGRMTIKENSQFHSYKGTHLVLAGNDPTTYPVIHIRSTTNTPNGTNQDLTVEWGSTFTTSNTSLDVFNSILSSGSSGSANSAIKFTDHSLVKVGYRIDMGAVPTD